MHAIYCFNKVRSGFIESKSLSYDGTKDAVQMILCTLYLGPHADQRIKNPLTTLRMFSAWSFMDQVQGHFWEKVQVTKRK